MKCLTHLLLLTAIIICVTVQYSSGYRNDISKAFPLGIIGCKVSDVCRVDQLCEDDKLFGSCHSIDNLDMGVTFELTIPELKQLEAELLELKSQGFSWQDAFTQCILQNAIIAFAKRQSINLKDYCEYVLSMDESSWSQSTKMEIAAVLERLLEANEVQEEPVFDGNANWDLRSNSDKRDEIVEVHKYFDQSKGLKRNVLSELNEVPYNYLSQNSPLLEEDTSRLDEQAFGSPEQITAYLRVLDQLSNRAKLASTGKEVPQIYTDVRETMDTRNQEVGMEASMIAGTNNNKDPLNKDDTDNSIFSEVNEDAKGDEDAEDEYLTISPPDEKALEKLLSGDLDPHDIEMEQLKRLMKIVEIMVQQLDEEEIETGVKELTQTEDQILTPEEKNYEIKSDNQVAIMLPEKQDVVVDSDNIVVPGDDLIVSADKNLVPSNHLSLDKKAIDKAVAEESNKHEDEKPESLPSADDVVDMRYAYITLDRNIDEVEGGAFLEAFASVINLPTSSLNDVMILGDKITFEIQENPKYNASMVADKAENEEIIARLQKLTGLTILKAGIGKENQVEVRKNDNKYLVLTFILVGCIAGILLAVVVIYLIKRQSRSKEKLAELAEGAEGNEASKDYQDLCRQRMQSKSSEKPEPLHAASRIGSVSDQVRSPSSRSSTSSWSEEPVQSNMDISTGHIVLSYMEDHLNNQDRLDTEWESLSGYEAEPCNTKVASDAANMRKNRYGDILPYDHSRVVLTSAANVSGSDYINANFITDHDPRNPAFVVTQGTLPHTVADFWQMVWEQGSVVIVMLTKLTENGSSMCHRYWPEEGSDLYHIYEVHLVSEHTWCDDYLVRSFYLKNLQTNETRTVTQFHFVTWPNLGVPGSIKALLDFRRKVNKSYRGRSCPIVVHCSDGCDRSGTYILIDMVLNRMAKGAKEIDMAATLEHIRDQRMSMVKTKEQFQFALASVAEEVHAILKALPQ